MGEELVASLGAEQRERQKPTPHVPHSWSSVRQGPSGDTNHIRGFTELDVMIVELGVDRISLHVSLSLLLLMGWGAWIRIVAVTLQKPSKFTAWIIYTQMYLVFTTVMLFCSSVWQPLWPHWYIFYSSSSPNCSMASWDQEIHDHRLQRLILTVGRWAKCDRLTGRPMGIFTK